MNWSFELVALVPPGVVVTVTSTVPVPAGTVAVMVVELLTVNVVAGLLGPKSTAVAPVKLVPPTVTEVPAGPPIGSTRVTVGGGGGGAT